MDIEDFKYCSIDNLEDAINLLNEVLKILKNYMECLILYII